MDTSLEDYIASNAKLQETIKNVKAQINASRVNKNPAMDVDGFAANESPKSPEEKDEVLINEENDVIWKGPSSKTTFLSFNFKEDDCEFEQMYDKLNSGLKEVELKENSTETNTNLEQIDDEFDLRQILDKKRLGSSSLPSISSQQWRLREPNLGGKRPAGMPPLVPFSLLDHANMNRQKINNANKGMKKRWPSRNQISSQKRNKNFLNNSCRELPQVWDTANRSPSTLSAGASVNSIQSVRPSQTFLANTSPKITGIPVNSIQNTASSIQALMQNAAIPLNSNLNVQPVQTFIPNTGILNNLGGGVQCLPLGTLLAAAPYLNANASKGAFVSPNQSNLIVNDALGLNRAAGYNLSNGNEETNTLNGRSDLHGIRTGRVEHLQQQGGSQTENILHRALRLFLQSGNANGNGTAINTGETPLNDANQLVSFTSAVQNMLQRGIVIKLAEAEEEH